MDAISGDVVERVRMEYLEMPGLALTSRQATRLLNLDADVCEYVLAELVRDSFLSRTANGTFLRRASGPHQIRSGQCDVASTEPLKVEAEAGR